MGRIHDQILQALSKRNYQPVKTRELARKLGHGGGSFGSFRQALADLVQQGRVEITRSQTIRKAGPQGTVVGTYRTLANGGGFVRPHAVDGNQAPEIRIFPENALDASTGDIVMVQILRKATQDRPATGQILRVTERQSHQFVGTYFERSGEGFVKVDGKVFAHSILIGDPTTKNVKPGDKVVFDMIRFPSPEERGQGVITEVLGPQGAPGVDTLAIMRAYHLPDHFPKDVLDEAHHVAENFSEENLDGRKDFTADLVVTVDPIDAKDFDDAVQVIKDEKTGHWSLAVHIADVCAFVKPGGVLDREARSRATSIYLPGKVIPMFPETISNHLASLQQDKVRYVQSVFMEFDPEGRRTETRFERGAIRVKRRFHYEEVQAFLDNAPNAPALDDATGTMVKNMRELALILRLRRHRKGYLQLDMPEPELEMDRGGKVTGAHYRYQDLSHQIIEEFMLCANEAVAERLRDADCLFLRRIHPEPDPLKLKAFGRFASSLGFDVENPEDRFALQRVLEESAEKPERTAVHYALLRSLKQAVYSPQEEGHYALSSSCYCHFTSPIRRYPDLTVHRQLDRLRQTGKGTCDESELAFLGEHCSAMERRADLAERELVKVKLLELLATKLGDHMPAMISGVAEYGFFAELKELPVEGLVHISNLHDDIYRYDGETHTLTGMKFKRRFRLGDEVTVEIARVDMPKRQLDFRPVLAITKQPKRGQR